MVSGAEAKRDIWTFLTLLLLFSSIFYALVFSGPHAPKQWGSYAFLFMWCPGLAALITNDASSNRLFNCCGSRDPDHRSDGGDLAGKGC